MHPQRPGALPFLNHDKGVWTEFGLKGADALRVNGGPALDAPLLGVNRRAQLPTGVLLRAGLAPGLRFSISKSGLDTADAAGSAGRRFGQVVGAGTVSGRLDPRGWTPSLFVRKNGRALPIMAAYSGTIFAPNVLSGDRWAGSAKLTPSFRVSIR